MILFQTLAEKLKTCKYGRVYHGCKNEKWKSHRIKLHLLEYRSPGDNLLYRISSSVRDAQVGWVMSDNCIIISIVTPNCKQTIITMITTNIIFNGQPHPVPCHCKKKFILIAFRKYLSISWCLLLWAMEAAVKMCGVVVSMFAWFLFLYWVRESHIILTTVYRFLIARVEHIYTDHEISGNPSSGLATATLIGFNNLDHRITRPAQTWDHLDQKT